MRRRTRDMLYENHILERMVKDIHIILSEEEQLQDVSEIESPEAELFLWDDIRGTVNNGISY